MALPFSNTAGRTLERLRNAFIETARGAREVVGAPLRPDLPDDDIPRLRNRIDACLEGKGGETARRARAAELGQAYLSLSPAGRRKFLLTLANEYGLTREVTQKMGYHRELEAAVESMKALRRRGVRIMPGGDYGFPWTPHGTNAKDLEYFVKYVGMSPMEAPLSQNKGCRSSTDLGMTSAVMAAGIALNQ